MMLNPLLTSGKYQTLQSPSSHVFFWGWSEFQKKKTVRIVMLRSLKATPSVCLVLLRNLGAEVVLSHPVIFLNFSSSAGCSGCPEPSYLRSLMPSARYSPFFTSVSAFFVQCSRCRQSWPYPRRLSAATMIFFSFNILFVLFLNFFLREREKKATILQPMCIIVTTFEFKTVVPSPYDLTKKNLALLSGNNPHPFPVESKIFLN